MPLPVFLRDLTQISWTRPSQPATAADIPPEPKLEEAAGSTGMGKSQLVLYDLCSVTADPLR